MMSLKKKKKKRKKKHGTRLHNIDTQLLSDSYTPCAIIKHAILALVMALVLVNNHLI